MPIYIILYGTAQIPVEKIQNQAQNELKQKYLGKQGTTIYTIIIIQMILIEIQNRT